MSLATYFTELEDKIRVAYSVAEQARRKRLDPSDRVEIPLSTSLSERTESLIATLYPQLAGSLKKRLLELERRFGKLDVRVAFTIAREVASERFCRFRSQLEAIDAGIRTGLAYLTLAVVSSPLEGFTEIKVKKTRAGEDYFALYYSGPIRSAGGTAAALSVLLGDSLREHFGYAAYDATETEVKRAVTEIYDYHERVTNLQYLPGESEIETIVSNLPVQVDGEPSEDKEVSNYKDLPRIETNRLRSGFCLVLAEGIAQKAAKLTKAVQKLRQAGFPLSAWDFLTKVKRSGKSKTESETAVYIRDLVAGRPVLGHPWRKGAFRLRYGRTRASGYSAMAIHPATMAVLDGFIAIGTQLKTEKPNKSTAITVCDSIDGPVVRLKDGTVTKLTSFDEASKVKSQIDEVLYLGDILVAYGDFYNRNHPLLKPGWNEESWKAALKEAGKKVPRQIDIKKASLLALDSDVPLHPAYTFLWTQVTNIGFASLLRWVSKGKLSENSLILPYGSHERESLKAAKEALEHAAVKHFVITDSVIIEGEEKDALLTNLGISGVNEASKLADRFEKTYNTNSQKSDVLEFLNSVNKIKLADKVGTFINARMGRPEKAKQRKLTGSPNCLFPVGEQGGRLRSVNEASKIGFVEADFPLYFCENCQSETVYFLCENCGRETTKLLYCPLCLRTVSEHCPKHGGIERGIVRTFKRQKIDIKRILEKAKSTLDLNELPDLIKGVKGTSSAEHVVERLEKGILRASFGLQVNKDGTVRFDVTELPLTHFKPREIGTSIEKLRQLGYKKDVEGRELESEDQLLALKPQDVILPACPEAPDEQADSVFVRIANFVDSLLTRLYRQKPFYNVSVAADLIGHLVLCIAPHNSAGVIGRIIGFSKIQALLATPFFHAAMRRDADGDEAAVMLLLDSLLNFSRAYLPAHRGGTQDAPLLANGRLRIGEVDDMVFDIELVREFPLAFFEAAGREESPSAVKLDQVGDHLDRDIESPPFTHDVSAIDGGILCSAYKKLATMSEKVAGQMSLAKKLRSVDEADVARLVIERHLLRDIRGNLRKFSQQQFRCVNCNAKYRRPPLAGFCQRCKGRIVFTIAEGTIRKYMQPAVDLAKRYKVSDYVRQTLELTQASIDAIFGRESETQESLGKFFT